MVQTDMTNVIHHIKWYDVFGPDRRGNVTVTRSFGICSISIFHCKFRITNELLVDSESPHQLIAVSLEQFRCRFLKCCNFYFLLHAHFKNTIYLFFSVCIVTSKKIFETQITSYLPFKKTIVCRLPMQF